MNTYYLEINENDETGVTAVAFVDKPAIELNWKQFNSDFVVEPRKGESQEEFVSRCIGEEVNAGKDKDQAVAICYAKWDAAKFAKGDKVSFDFDETLTTAKGQELAIKEIENGSTIYIISARNDKASMYDLADKLGISHNNIYATGSNKAKVEKIKELGINKHYDNNADVISELGNIGIKFNQLNFESYTDYPEAAKENAKIALRWAEANGWGDCGTDVGKQRANQLAKGEPISRDTIARMAAFERHRQNSQKELGDGCGRLMWLAWGGDEGIAWAQRKLKQIDNSFHGFQTTDKERKIVSGVLMLANTPIYRRDEHNGEYNVIFTPDTIEKIVNKFFKQGNQSSVNGMHNSDFTIDGVYMFESFIIDKSRGIKAPEGFGDIPEGSWFGSFKVENQDIWNSYIKTGVFKGFSVEGMFNQTLTKADNAYSEMFKLIDEILLLAQNNK